MQDLEVGLIAGLVALAYVYFITYLIYIRRAFVALRGEPYSQFK